MLSGLLIEKLKFFGVAMKIFGTLLLLFFIESFAVAADASREFITLIGGGYKITATKLPCFCTLLGTSFT